jgi:hypothetical protein
MTKAAASVWIRRPQDVALTDFTPWVDRENGAGYKPPSSDLHGVITQAVMRFVNPEGDPDGPIPYEPQEGHEFVLRDALAQDIFGGYIASPVISVPGPRVPAWEITATSHAGRLAEQATGSLNKAGILDSDRNFAIAIVRDCLAAAAQTYGTDAVGTDDPVVAANEAVGWSGVRHTAFIYGTDWSYRQGLNAIQDLMKRVPGTSFRIRPDRIVEYGVFATPAPVALAAVPDAILMPAANVIEIDADSYQEEVMNAGHFNKVRLGGFGAAEHTAYDTTSIGLLGRVMATPYENDETIPADDIERSAYAKLAEFKRRRVARAITTNDVDALEPGMLVPVLVSDLGCAGDEGWSAPMEHEGYIGTPLQEPASGHRGELIVQKVTPTFIAPGVQAYEIELGDYIADFDRAVAERIGGEVTGG